MDTEIITTYPNGHDSTGILERESPKPATGIVERASPQLAIKITRAHQEETDAPATVEQISTDELYRNLDEDVSPELTVANRIMSECLGHANRAIAADREGEMIMADDAMQSVQILLPELFCCRTLGEGFAIVSNGLLCAFQNLEGKALKREQMDAIRRTLEKLRSEPFLSTDIAVDRLSELEDVELKVEPPEFHILADLLDE